MASKPLNGAPLAAAVAAVHGAIRALLLRHLATAPPPVNGGGLLHGSAGLIGQIRISAFKNGFGPLCLCPCHLRCLPEENLRVRMRQWSAETKLLLKAPRWHFFCFNLTMSLFSMDCLLLCVYELCSMYGILSSAVICFQVLENELR